MLQTGFWQVPLPPTFADQGGYLTCQRFIRAFSKHINFDVSISFAHDKRPMLASETLFWRSNFRQSTTVHEREHKAADILLYRIPDEMDQMVMVPTPVDLSSAPLYTQSNLYSDLEKMWDWIQKTDLKSLKTWRFGRV